MLSLSGKSWGLDGCKSNAYPFLTNECSEQFGGVYSSCDVIHVHPSADIGFAHARGNLCACDLVGGSTHSFARKT